MITTRKVTLYPLGDKNERARAYQYIRNGMKVQALMMNKCISALYCARQQNMDFKSEEYKELKKLYSRVPTSNKGSAYDFDMALYPKGLPVAGNVPRVCEAKLIKAMKDGLMYGKVSLPTFRDSAPMCVHNDYVNVMGVKKDTVGFYTNYNSAGELAEKIYEDDKCVFLKFANGLEFVVKFGNPYRSRELRNVFERLFSKEYHVCDSSIGIDKKDSKKIILNMSVEMPINKENKLDENTVLGVSTSIVCPCVCALNNSNETATFGNFDDFVRVRRQMQEQRRSIQSTLKNTSGGHGRKKKLAHLEKLALNERNFAHTYNHTMSKRVVDYAVEHKAKYINLEDLSEFKNEKNNEFALRNWSYFELQSMIEYKALREGIVVRKVSNKGYDPEVLKEYEKEIELKNGKYVFTDTDEEIPHIRIKDICSFCGKNGTVTDGLFVCSDSKCKIHKKYPNGVPTQINEAKNLAVSELVVEKPKKQKKKEEK